MPRIAYVNGSYVPYSQAVVHIEDRGFQFADGIYQVITRYKNKFLDCQAHLDRLEYFLREIHIEKPVSQGVLRHILEEVARRNYLSTGSFYLQVTRGQAARVHWFPEEIKPTLVVVGRTVALDWDHENLAGVQVISGPDLRWKRANIKSISLLPNVLARQYARQHNAFDMWLLDEEGYVTEGASSNAWMVTQKGEILTRPESDRILSGVTRARILKLCREAGLKVTERPFTLQEALEGAEAFLTGATSLVRPILRIDQSVIAQGNPGPLTKEIAKLYREYCEQEVAA